MRVTREVTRDIVLEESAGADAWAKRNGWLLDWDFDGLALRATRAHPVDGQELYLAGSFDDYRAIPPDWQFTTSDGDPSSPAAWPSSAPVAGQSSVLHSVGVICASFSRRAYREFNGPHAGGWGSCEAWLDISEGVQARTLGDMLAVIGAHVRVSPGRMG